MSMTRRGQDMKLKAMLRGKQLYTTSKQVGDFSQHKSFCCCICSNSERAALSCKLLIKTLV